MKNNEKFMLVANFLVEFSSSRKDFGIEILVKKLINFPRSTQQMKEYFPEIFAGNSEKHLELICFEEIVDNKMFSIQPSAVFDSLSEKFTEDAALLFFTTVLKRGAYNSFHLFKFKKRVGVNFLLDVSMVDHLKKTFGEQPTENLINWIEKKGETSADKHYFNLERVKA